MDNIAKDEKRERASGFSGVNRFKLSDFVIMFIIVLLCLLCVVPIWHVAVKSVSSNTAVISKTVTMWPIGFNVDAYKSIIRDGQMVHALWYTIEVTVLFTVIGMIITVCAAWPLSRARLKGRKIFNLIILFTMYFTVPLIPEFLLYQDLHLYNTMWVLVLPLCFAPYNMLIMRSFMNSTIPDSLEEAAFLDGASNFQILWRIVLPLSKPILATISLFYAVGRWNAYADAKYYVRSRALQPLQLILSNMVITNEASINDPTGLVSTPEVMQSAAVMFATVPILLVYPFVQKYFVKGVMIGAVKG